MPTSPIKCVIFDLGGVIVDQMLLLQDADKRMVTMPGKFRQLFELVEHSNSVMEMERGEMKLSQYCKFLFEHVADEHLDEMRAVHDNFDYNNLTILAARPNPALREDMVDLVKQLSSSGFKTALLTNTFYTNDHQQESLTLCPRDIFHVVVESCRVGMRKPESRMYKHLLGKVGLRAEQCLYVDESEANCQGAEACGIQSVRIADSRHTIDHIYRILNL